MLGKGVTYLKCSLNLTNDLQNLTLFQFSAQGKFISTGFCHLWVFLYSIFRALARKSYMQKIVTLKLLVAIF